MDKIKTKYRYLRKIQDLAGNKNIETEKFCICQYFPEQYPIFMKELRKNTIIEHIPILLQKQGILKKNTVNSTLGTYYKKIIHLVSHT